MAKVSGAKRVRNMIRGLEGLKEEIKQEYDPLSSHQLQLDIDKALSALEKVWKNLVG